MYFEGGNLSETLDEDLESAEVEDLDFDFDFEEAAPDFEENNNVATDEANNTEVIIPCKEMAKTIDSLCADLPESSGCFEIKSDTEQDTTYNPEDVQLTKTTEEIEFPYIFLQSDTIETHTLLALKSMLIKKAPEPDVTVLHVYLGVQDNTFLFGEITNRTLRTILANSLFKSFSIYAKLSETLKIEGDMLYALCATSV